MKLEKTQRTKVNRVPKRASYHKQHLNRIIDEALIGHLAFNHDNSAHSIPMLFWRHQDALYCHCSVNSRLSNLAATKQDVSISFSILDGLVLAKSAFHHSVNYRSAVVYGQFELITDDAEVMAIMESLMNLIAPQRWQEVRTPNKKELNATAVLKIPLTEAVVKMRKGPPADKKSDQTRDVWAGVIPITHTYGDGIKTS